MDDVSISYQPPGLPCQVGGEQRKGGSEAPLHNISSPNSVYPHTSQHIFPPIRPDGAREHDHVVAIRCQSLGFITCDYFDPTDVRRVIMSRNKNSPAWSEVVAYGLRATGREPGLRSSWTEKHSPVGGFCEGRSRLFNVVFG